MVGLVALTVYLTTKASVMKMAVGPKGSRDVEFVEKLAEKFRSERAPIRIQPVITPGAVALADIHGKAPFDLAVVRGNLDLSTDWPVVAILRQDVVVLIVPTPDAYAPKRGRRHGKIEKVSELVGKRVGIVDSTDGGADLLNVILKHYGVPADKVKVVNVAPQDLKKAIHDDLIDVVLAAGPQTGDAVGQAVLAASAGKEGPSFIEIDQAEGIGKRLPPYELGRCRGRRIRRHPAGAGRQAHHPQISDLHRGAENPECRQGRGVRQTSLSEQAIARLPTARAPSQSSRPRPTRTRPCSCIRAPPTIWATIPSRSSTSTATRSSTAC